MPDDAITYFTEIQHGSGEDDEPTRLEISRFRWDHFQVPSSVSSLGVTSSLSNNHRVGNGSNFHLLKPFCWCRNLAEPTKVSKLV